MVTTRFSTRDGGDRVEQAAADYQLPIGLEMMLDELLDTDLLRTSYLTDWIAHLGGHIMPISA